MPPLSRLNAPLPLSVNVPTLFLFVVVFVSETVPVELPDMVRPSGVPVVPIAPPEASLMPPLPVDNVTPVPDAETIADIVDALLPVAVKLAAPLAVTLWLSANDVPDKVKAAVDIAPPIVIVPASVTLMLPAVVEALS